MSTSISKKCTKCGASAPDTAQVGQRCTNCGAIWSAEVVSKPDGDDPGLLAWIGLGLAIVILALPGWLLSQVVAPMRAGMLVGVACAAIVVLVLHATARTNKTEKKEYITGSAAGDAALVTVLAAILPGLGPGVALYMSEPEQGLLVCILVLPMVMALTAGLIAFLVERLIQAVQNKDTDASSAGGGWLSPPGDNL